MTLSNAATKLKSHIGLNQEISAHHQAPNISSLVRARTRPAAGCHHNRLPRTRPAGRRRTAPARRTLMADLGRSRPDRAAPARRTRTAALARTGRAALLQSILRPPSPAPSRACASRAHRSAKPSRLAVIESRIFANMEELVANHVA